MSNLRCRTCIPLLTFVLVSCAEPKSTPVGPAASNIKGPVYSGGGIGGTETDVELASIRQDAEPSGGGFRIGACMGTEAYLSGLTSGMKDESDLNCNSNEIVIETAVVTEYSLDATTYFPVPAGGIECPAGSPIFLNVQLVIVESANSPRTDIGIWASTDGGDAITGTCGQYTLFASGAPGTVNLDGDLCGDMLPNTRLTMPLGIFDSICSGSGMTSVHIGTCIGWTTQGSDRVCPAPGPTGYRVGAVPANKSKCNCSGFDIPINVVE